MAIVTFTSDFGLQDYYVAAVKGQILTQAPDAKIVDISHAIQPFNILQASFVVKHVFKDFPPGTIHLIAVDPGSWKDNKYLITEHNKHLFVAPDNGVIPLITEGEGKHVEINFPGEHKEGVFPSRDILGKATGFLAKGGKPDIIGLALDEVETKIPQKPIVSTKEIKGHVVYIDRFGNCITNIDRSTFKNIGSGRNPIIHLGVSRYKVNKISEFYSDVSPGESVVLFNPNGLLQVSINRGVNNAGGGASQLLGLRLNHPIRIVFDD